MQPVCSSSPEKSQFQASLDAFFTCSFTSHANEIDSDDPKRPSSFIQSCSFPFGSSVSFVCPWSRRREHHLPLCANARYLSTEAGNAAKRRLFANDHTNYPCSGGSFDMKITWTPSHNISIILSVVRPTSQHKTPPLASPHFWNGCITPTSVDPVAGRFLHVGPRLRTHTHDEGKLVFASYEICNS